MGGSNSGGPKRPKSESPFVQQNNWKSGYTRSEQNVTVIILGGDNYGLTSYRRLLSGVTIKHRM